MLSKFFNTFSPSLAARHLLARILCVALCYCLLFAPIKGMADNPPGAPPNTRIMLINPYNVPEDVTTRFNGGQVHDFYGEPPIPLCFNYTTEQVYNSASGNVIGYMVYPN